MTGPVDITFKPRELPALVHICQQFLLGTQFVEQDPQALPKSVHDGVCKRRTLALRIVQEYGRTTP